MDKTIVSHLLSVNRQFYQTLGLQFSEKRQRPQPGVMRMMPRFTQEAKILDLGCGNGQFACELARRAHQGEYIGLDFSLELLSEARAALDECLPTGLEDHFELQQVDLTSPEWDLPFEPASFDFITAFAVLHHVPGEQLRRELLRKVHNLIAPDGRVILSVWQFLNSPRLVKRVQPWEKIGLSAQDVDPGDYLLDWLHGGSGIRYVHHFTHDSLTKLAEVSGFSVMESFHSDGYEGRLGLYQIWSPIC